MYVVYIIYSGSLKKFYIGQTNNFKIRLAKHNNGLVKSTKNGKPWQVVRLEYFNTRSEAIRRERQIKSYKSGNGFKKLINQPWVGTEVVKRGRL